MSWEDACTRALSKSHDTIMSAIYAFCGVTIAAYCISAVAGGFAFLMWRRLPSSARQVVWPLYGWFSALMTCASCFGSISWGTWMQSSAYSLEGKFSLADMNSPSFPGFVTFARHNRWYAAFHVAYAVEFFCQSVALLAILDRLVNLAMHKSGDWMRFWLIGKRAVIALVAASNLAGICGNAVAAAAYSRTADLWDVPDRLSIVTDPFAFMNAIQAAIQQRASADSAATVQQFCEVVSLLLILAAFLVTGIACIHRVNDWLSNHSKAASSEVRKLHLQIALTCSIVFVTFLLRTVHAILFALAHLLQNSESLPSCLSLAPDLLCNSNCLNNYTLLLEWMRFTPEFRLSIILISSPLSLLVALWGMTSRQARTLMTSRAIESQLQALSQFPLSVHAPHSTG